MQMFIGLTYDLKSLYLSQGYLPDQVAEFDSEETISAIENTLNLLGHKTERIGNIHELTIALAKRKRWDLVFNIAEGMFGRGREAQIPALLEAFEIPFTFSDSLTMALTLEKSATKRFLRDQGISTGAFWVIDSMDELKKPNFNYPLFVKPVAEGSGKGIDEAPIVNNFRELKADVEKLLTIYGQRVLIEEYLPGREFTVGIVGTGKNAKVIGNIEIIFTDPKSNKIYNLETKNDYENRVIYKPCSGPLSKALHELALKTYRLLNCRDAGRVDIKLNKVGVPTFLEINPLAGINPIHSDLPILSRMNGLDYTELIRLIIASASERVVNNKHVLFDYYSTIGKSVKNRNTQK
jgi:D-alanine-D-alanine ligase